MNRAGWMAIATYWVILGSLVLAKSPSKLRGNGGAAPGGFRLLTFPSVQEELRLDPGQVEKSMDLSRELRTVWEATKKSANTLPPNERFQRLAGLADDHYQDGMARLAVILKPVQLDRFDQIMFQRRGIAAMLEARVSNALKLTEAQRQRLTVHLNAWRDEQSKLLGRGEDSRTLETKRRENAERFRNKAIGELTPEQKLAWDQVSGPFFEPPISEVLTP